ncbi:hypothetical protein [Salinicoccus roseus]|uniref:hypothetical protein n=1 Tax=Salinicoccus roseus TaxID=45670 RepID=UPI002FE0850E
MERDKNVTKYYIQNDWTIKRVWEHDVKENSEDVIKELVLFIEDAKTIRNEHTK